MISEYEDLTYVFDYADIQSDFLRRMVNNVLTIMGKSLDLDELSLGPLHEGRTISGEAGEVTEDGTISLDSKILEKYDDDVAMAIIAHEFAHAFLEHYTSSPQGLEYEGEADALARQWGFNIDKFRTVCGPATKQKRNSSTA